MHAGVDVVQPNDVLVFSFHFVLKGEGFGRHWVVVVQLLKQLLDDDVGEQTQGTEEHASEDARHDGEVRDVGPPRVQDEEARGPQIEHDEVRPPGQNRSGVREHSAQALGGAERRGVNCKQSLGEEHVSEHDVHDGVGYGDGEGDGLSVAPSGKEQQGNPRGEAAQVHRVQNLVVGEGQKRDGARSRNCRTLRFGGGEGRA